MGWLVLSRKRSENVVLVVPPSNKPTRIVVGVDDIRPNGVRLGFNAPCDVAVHRAEVQAEIDGQEREREQETWRVG